MTDNTAGLASAPAVATVRQVSPSAPAPATATVPQQSTFFGVAFLCCVFTQGSSRLVRNLIAQAFFSWTESDANQTEPQHLVCIDGGALVKYNRRGYLEEMNILIFESLLVYCILLW